MKKYLKKLSEITATPALFIKKKPKAVDANRPIDKEPTAAGGWEHPPGHHEAFPHETPALDAAHQPVKEKHNALHNTYNDEHAHFKQLSDMNAGSLNTVLRGQMHDGTNVIVKPHDELSVQSDRWHSRHDAVHRILTHMGASHMVSPAIDTNLHSSARMPKDAATIGMEHGGKKAFVTAAIDGVNLHAAHPDDINAIDGEHRLHGLVTHILSGNADGHPGNVMVSHGPDGKPHPVLIDHDLTFNSGQDLIHPRTGGALPPEKPKSLLSVFAPGNTLDYRHKMGEVGTNFPPRMKKTLEWLAAGGHRHSKHGITSLKDDDADVLQQHAQELLTHGLEGTLARRHLVGEKE